MEQQMPVEPIVVGKIHSPYGIFGWLKMSSFTEEREKIFNYSPWFVQKMHQWKEINPEKWCYRNQHFIIKLRGIDDRSTANSFINAEIVIDVSQLPVPENGDFYWKDLIGCHVITIRGFYLGKVINLMKTKSRDVLIIKKNLKSFNSREEKLIPFLEEQIIKQVDLIARSIKVDWDSDF